MLDAFRARQKEVKSQLNNLVDAIAQHGHSELLSERLTALEEEHSNIATQLAKEELSAPPIERDFVLWWLLRGGDWDASTVEGKTKLINTFVSNVTVSDADEGMLRVVIDYNFRDTSGEFYRLDVTDEVSNLSVLAGATGFEPI